MPVSPRFAPGAADRWRMPKAPEAGSWSAVFQHDSSRAQAHAQAARPDQSRWREARKNKWCHWRQEPRRPSAQCCTGEPDLEQSQTQQEDRQRELEFRGFEPDTHPLQRSVIQRCQQQSWQAEREDAKTSLEQRRRRGTHAPAQARQQVFRSGQRRGSGPSHENLRVAE